VGVEHGKHHTLSALVLVNEFKHTWLRIQYKGTEPWCRSEYENSWVRVGVLSQPQILLPEEIQVVYPRQYVWRVAAAEPHIASIASPRLLMENQAALRKS
jgi:hypothetical protein